MIPLSNTGQTPEEKQPEQVNVLHNAMEIEAKARRDAELKERARQAAEAEAQYQAREEYAKTLQEEKVELIRMKQGEEYDSERVFGKQEEAKKYTVTEKIGNWLYHAKWWLGIAVFAAFLIGFLVYDYATRVDPDIRILLLTEHAELYAESPQIESWLTEITDDFNGDGDTVVQSVYVPVSVDTMENAGSFTATYNSQLMVQFQTATCMLVIADPVAEEYLQPEYMFEDLSAMYPDCKYIDGYKLMLNDTDLVSRIGLSQPFKENAYLALRVAQENMSSLEENEQAQKYAKTVLDRLVQKLK